MIGAGFGRAGAAIGGFNEPFFGNMTYNSDPSGSYFSNNIEVVAVVSGGLVQSSPGTGNPNYSVSTESFARKSLFLFTYQVSAGSIANTYALYHINNFSASNLNHNYTDHSLNSALQLSATSVVFDGNASGNKNGSIVTGWNSGSYPLNLVNIFWTGSSPVRIYDVAVSVIR
jgi:hypothetical protein